MIERTLDVAHLLVRRIRQGEQQFLFYPHRRWIAEASGQAYLALPTKKIVPEGQPLASSAQTAKTVDVLLRDELGLGKRARPWYRPLPPVTLELRSPARKQLTCYRIAPVMVPSGRAEHEELRQRVGGLWLSRGEALRHPELSPTARSVLTVLHRRCPDASATAQAAPAANDWTGWLVWARDVDRDSFGRVFAALTPWLTACLRSSEDTRGLFAVPQDVEEALSDACLNALLALEGFDEEGSGRDWLRTITRNAAISILRARTHNHADTLEQGEGALPPDPTSREPIDLLTAAEARHFSEQQLERALSQLPPGARQAWKMRSEEEELSYADVADRLGVAAPTVGGWFHRLKKLLRQEGRGR